MTKKASQIKTDIANAAVTVALEKNQIETILDNLFLFAQILEQNPDLPAMLAEISLPIEQRILTIKQVCQDFSDISINTIAVLIQNNLINDMAAFNEALTQSARQLANHHECTVKSAVELNEKQKQNITQALKNRFQGTIRTEFTIDPKILGGIEISCGDWRFLSTIQSKIQQLHKHLIIS